MDILLRLLRKGLGALLYLLPYQQELHADIIMRVVGLSN
jgi:hypothetical protein